MLKMSESRAVGITLLLAAGLLIAPASAQKLYKWVDEQGNVTYEHRPPPDNAKVLEEYSTPPEEGQETASAPVTLYSVPQCDACDLVRLLLQKNSVPFAEKNPSQDKAAADELKEKSGQLSVPSLTIGDKLLMGYNSLAIRDELKSAGYSVQDETAAEPANPPTGETAEAPAGAPGEAAAAGEEAQSEPQPTAPAPQ